jgi:hypothetical protein
VHLDRFEWRTSSYSASSGASCMEVPPLPAYVVVRAKDRASAPHLHSAAWRTVLAGIRDGEFDR